MSDVKKELDLLPKTMKETYTKKEMAKMITLLARYFSQILGTPTPKTFEDPSVIENNGEQAVVSLTGRIEGAALTQLESSIVNKEQLKAAKDMLKMVWRHHKESVRDFIWLDIGYVCSDNKEVINRPSGFFLKKMIKILHKS